jgi:hypothetical protein
VYLWKNIFLALGFAKSDFKSAYENGKKAFYARLHGVR